MSRLAEQPPDRHRRDIQGLRAVAVLLVALNHARVPGLGGGYVGVDVFFVLSGFLITGILLRDAARTRHVSLVDFYVRRGRRILPAATLTLTATAIASYQLLNYVRAREVLHDVLASAVFGANVRFAHVGTDYFAQGRPESPVRHFWSLAVEEQFYVVWPALLAIVVFGVALLRRRRSRRPAGRHAMTRLALFLVAVIALSLYWSIDRTRVQPAAAYFSTFTRAWELGLGALLATASGLLMRLPGGVRVALGWAGVAAIVLAGTLFTSSTPFPGSAALVPTLGAALVIAAAVRPGMPALAAGRLLSVAPLAYVGDLSYSFYLWHWPVLALAREYHGSELPLATNLLLLVGAFALSAVTYHLFENPLRRPGLWRPPSTAMLLWLAGPLIVVFVCIGTQRAITQRILRDDAQASVAVPAGAANAGWNGQAAAADTGDDGQDALATSTGQPLRAVTLAVRAAQSGARIPAGLTPSIADAASDRFTLPSSCSAGFGPRTSSQICSLGAGGGGRTMVVMGDSHGQMWTNTLAKAAGAEGYQLRPIVKPGCLVATWAGYPAQGEPCTAWFRWAEQQASRMHPDVFVLAGEYMSGLSDPARRDDALRAITGLLRVMHRHSGRVVVLGDVPGIRQPPSDCLLRRNATMKTCSFAPTPDQAAMRDAVTAEAQAAGAGFVDSYNWFCAEDLCPTVIDSTIAYIDDNHISETYAARLVTPMRVALRQAIRGGAQPGRTSSRSRGSASA